MADSAGKTGDEEGPQIDVRDDSELGSWAKKFDATPDQIRAAVEAVGHGAADVEMYLKGTHATTNADQEARAEGERGG
jgi:hypothetical protein